MSKLTKIASAILLMTSIPFSAHAENRSIVNALVKLDAKSQLHWYTQNKNGTWEAATEITSTENRLKKALLMAPLPLEDVLAGGVGGNENTGYIYYDGQSGPNHANALKIQRNPITKTCYLQNNDIAVHDWNNDLDIVSFPCEEKDPNHNGLYWFSGFDYINGTYNPGFDAFYAVQAATEFYKNNFYRGLWQYKNAPANKVFVFIHANEDRFYKGGFFSNDPWYISLSDGDQTIFPSTSIDVINHLIGEGVALTTWGFSWGIGDTPAIAFSYCDIFAKAVEYSATGTTNWEFGKDIKKHWGVLRYMDKPTQDCQKFQVPGSGCSIQTYQQFLANSRIEPKYGSGLLNHVFYRIATSSHWNTKEAFLLLNHSTSYWMNSDWHNPKFENDYDKVFCSLVLSAGDLKYREEQITEVKQVLEDVGMNLEKC